MLKSEVEHLLKLWSAHELKIYKWQKIIGMWEYITFRKSVYIDTNKMYFDQDREKSTCAFPSTKEEDMIKMISNGELIYVKDWTWSADILKLKTGGCTCGAWVMKDNTYFHDLKCPLYKDPEKAEPS